MHKRRYLSPLELLNIATQHAICADHMLQHSKRGMVIGPRDEINALSPVTTLMHLAFQLTFKAYCLHEHRPVKQPKNLLELLELNDHLHLSSKDVSLLKTLTRQQVFNKGMDPELWENEQQIHVFCEEILSLFERVLMLMPLELQPDYQ